jgi:hypothetical protein
LIEFFLGVEGRFEEGDDENRARLVVENIE